MIEIYDSLQDVQDAQRYLIEIFRYPPALAKACFDPYHYEIMMIDDVNFTFSKAKAINKKWVHLEKCNFEADDHCLVKWERGVDVAVDKIIWVRDCGS